MNLWERYVAWCHAKDVPFWHFWDMRSGHIGGAIAAVLTWGAVGILWGIFG